MKEDTFLQKLLDLRYLPFQIYYWWERATCEHAFNQEFIEKGWFTTGFLMFRVVCSKCYKMETINMKFPIESKNKYRLIKKIEGMKKPLIITKENFQYNSLDNGIYNQALNAVLSILKGETK